MAVVGEVSLKSSLIAHKVQRSEALVGHDVPGDDVDRRLRPAAALRENHPPLVGPCEAETQRVTGARSLESRRSFEFYLNSWNCKTLGTGSTNLESGRSFPSDIIKYCFSFVVIGSRRSAKMLPTCP